MEDRSALFHLSIDAAAREHLSEAARWARFLAIAGFVFLVLLVLSGISASVAIDRFSRTREIDENTGLTAFMGATTAVAYIFMALIWLFPLLSLLRFANALRDGLAASEQTKVNEAFQNLKSCLRYVGIVTVIGMVFMALAVLITLAGAAASS